MPLVNRTFDQLIDFTRTSAATFVNSSGNIASTPQSRNLLTFTQEFANAAWTKTNAQIVPNVNPAAASLGSELITNGDFASDTVWTKGAGWSIAAGVATRVAAGSGSILSQAITVVAGRLYAVTYTISGFSAGSINSSFSGGTTVNGATRSANGTYTEYLVAASGNTTFELVCGSASAAMSIDNVSVREVIGGALQAPDGTFTADTIIATGTATPAVSRNFASTAAAHTFSAYLKQGNTTFSEIEIIDQGTVSNRVRLTYATGALTVVAGSPTGTATSVGNGWWRVTITYTFPAIGAADTVVVYPSTTTGSIGDYCFLWGAQLEQASSATDYTRNFGGLFPPRFDYDPVTRAPRGLLIEEQRTNLLTYSEQFDNGAWAKTNATVTANSTTSPDGTVDADTLVEDTANSTHRISQGFSGVSGTSYTFTVYAKASTRSWVALQFTSNLFGDGLARTAYVNLSTGAIGTLANAPTVVVTNAGNGWYRIAVTVAATATSASAAVLVYLANADNSASYTGDGTSGIFIYGAQLEAGAFATSYIPTVASQVTRSADSALIQAPMFASWYNSAEGTLLVEGTISPNVDSAVGNYYAAISDGTTSNTILIAEVNGSTSQVVTGGVIQFNETVGSEPTGTVKVALAYATNNTVSASNGTLGSTDTSVSIPTVNRLNIGSRGDLVSTGFANGHIRSLRYYPVRLTNAQLQALTA